MNNPNSCTQCGDCCKLFLINLDKAEYQSGKFRTIFDEFEKVEDFDEASGCGANLLAQNEDGGCVYLKNNSCSIHSDRPQVCREYFCNSREERFQEMHKTISDYKSNRVSKKRCKNNAAAQKTHFFSKHLYINI